MFSRTKYNLVYLGMIERGEIDIALTDIALTSDRNQVRKIYIAVHT